MYTIDYYYSAIKRNELLTHLTAWIHLKKCLIKETKQKGVHTLRFHLYKTLENINIYYIYSDRKHGVGRDERGVIKKHEKTFGVDEYVHYFH